MGEERQEGQEFCLEEWAEQGRAAAAPSLPPHIPTAPLPPAPSPCLALSTQRKQLSSGSLHLQQLLWSRHSFSGVPYLAGLVPPSPRLRVW